LRSDNAPWRCGRPSGSGGSWKAPPKTSLTAESRLDDPIYWLLDRERSDLVREALATMDEEKRTLLIWKYVDRMTYNQLADRLRVPAHVVEYRVVTAKKALRRLLIDCGIGEEDLP
jgi:RNA polymerase sigma factor (sigma-70 family)